MKKKVTRADVVRAAARLILATATLLYALYAWAVVVAR